MKTIIILLILSPFLFNGIKALWRFFKGEKVECGTCPVSNGCSCKTNKCDRC